MASLWKHPLSPYWRACFTAVAGQRRVQWKRSTFTKDRKLARRVADELEEAAQGRRSSDAVTTMLNRIEDLTTRRGLYRIFNEVLRKTTGSGLGGKSVRAYVNGWVETTRGEISPATAAKYV